MNHALQILAFADDVHMIAQIRKSLLKQTIKQKLRWNSRPRDKKIKKIHENVLNEFTDNNQVNNE